jgi:hypothetical protein
MVIGEKELWLNCRYKSDFGGASKQDLSQNTALSWVGAGNGQRRWTSVVTARSIFPELNMTAPTAYRGESTMEKYLTGFASSIVAITVNVLGQIIFSWERGGTTIGIR